MRIAIVLAALALAPGGASAQDAKNVHAGIELGGRGVKCTVLEVMPDGLLRRLMARTTNTTLSVLDAKGDFRKEAMDEAVKAIADFHKTCRETYKLPAARIHVVGSSGVPEAKNRAAFVAAVKKATGADMVFIDDKTEVALTFLGVVPKPERGEAVALDIGGGNTKGGYITDKNSLIYVAVPLGSVTFATKVRAAQKLSKGESFEGIASRLRNAELVKPLGDGARAMPELGRRKKVYLSGGMVWAMTSILRPEAVDDAYVTFTKKDIDAFAKLVRKTPGKMPGIDLNRIDDAGRRLRAKAQLEAVGKAYQAENLIAGAEILSALATAFDLGEKTLVFPRNGSFGWLTAYIAGEKAP
jgi:exopolyphosphatase/pppGpp-phosphohydrolase